jgi:hypothetical protein
MPVQYYSRGREDGPGDLFVATPSGGQPKPNYIGAWEATRAELEKRGIAADYLLHFGDCHVDDARNACLRYFMASGCPKLLFIDDDVGWLPDEFIEFIKHDRDVVAGVYPKKKDEPEFPVMPFVGEELRADEAGLVKVRGVPAGFLMLSRACVQRMMDASVPYFQENEDETHSHLVFERGIVDGRRWSGDYYFCRKWRELGGEVFVDPEINLTHCGLKTWGGTLGSHWRQQHGVIDPNLDAAMGLLKDGRLDRDIFTALAGLWGNIPYAAEADMVAYSYGAARRSKTILEVGAGVTTLAMGVAAQFSGAEVWTLEHDIGWFRKMRDYIARYRLSRVRLCYAPLREQADGSAWYEMVPELPEKFDLVVCDGPPRDLGDRGALWRNLGHKIDRAEWIIDDIGDPQKYVSWGRSVDVRGRFAVVTRPPSTNGD